MREGVKMRRCEDEKMRYRAPLLEEPCAQTLSGKIPRLKTTPIKSYTQKSASRARATEVSKGEEPRNKMKSLKERHLTACLSRPFTRSALGTLSP